MHNLDRFLGFSSTSHHLTRLMCRKSIDAVKGTGWLAERGVYYAIDTSKPYAKDLAAGTVTELQLDVAWEKIAAASVVTWRNLVNVGFLSWTVVRPAVVFLLPFWDMVWDSVEPLLMTAKEAVMDSAEDAYFTFEESVGEELAPTFREWAKALAPVARLPGNVYRVFVAVVVRPAVYFCTYPELHGDLEIPEKPVVERLRWGEKCRKTAWSEWGECSVQCGEGYRARVNYCGRREVVRCVGPGVMGCDEICDSGAIRDCAGRCMGRAEKDCKGVCGGSHAFGCDGKCADPPSALDAKGACCVSPTFVLPTTGLCNTTADEQTEMMAEASRLKRKLAEAKAQMAKGRVPDRDRKFRSNPRADAEAYAELERLAAEVSLADARAGISTGKDYLEDLEEEQALHEEEEAELAAAKAELAEKLRLKRELLARSKRPKSGGWGVAAAVGSTVSFVVSVPGRLARGVFSFAFSRWAVLLSSLASFVVALRAVVQYAARRLERELAKEDDDDGDAASVTSSILTRRVMDVIVGFFADLPETWAAYKKSREAAAQAAARKKAEAEAKRAAEPPAPAKAAATKAAETAFAASAVAAKTAVAATKTAVAVAKRAWAKRAAVAPSAVEEATKKGEAVSAASVLNAYETRRRCVVAMTNLSGDQSLPWRRRLRCFAALVRLAARGGSRPYLIASCGGVTHAMRALEQWVQTKTAGDPLQPGPDSALQLLRVLLDAPDVQATLMRLENVRNGEAAGVMLRVLMETPGVRPVQRAGLTSMWALVRLAGPESGVAERLLEDGLYEHLEDEWEDSKEDEGVALAIGGCVMQLALGNRKMQAVLTNLGAQALVARLFQKHTGLSYGGKFATLKTWLREQRRKEEGR